MFVVGIAVVMDIVDVFVFIDGGDDIGHVFVVGMTVVGNGVCLYVVVVDNDDNINYQIWLKLRPYKGYSCSPKVVHKVKLQ